ncbi:hypothetical protein [Blastococcus sp. SYSU D00813]
MSAPENEVPVAVPQNLLLARTADLAVALLGLQAYTTGVSFDLAVRARRGAPGLGTQTLNDVFWAHRGGAPSFLLGVEFADGSRASSAGFPDVAGDVVFHPGGGSGGESSVDQSWWLSPLPPEGPLRLVVRCPELGVPETSVELDGTAIRRAGESALVLWPWQPLGDEPEPPRPADLPPDSWFAR